MQISCNAKMDEIHDRQQEIIDKNNKLYKDVETLKFEITRLESRNDSLTESTAESRSMIPRLGSRNETLTESTSGS